jgi:hypothetical protein
MKSATLTFIGVKFWQFTSYGPFILERIEKYASVKKAMGRDLVASILANKDLFDISNDLD